MHTAGDEAKQFEEKYEAEPRLSPECVVGRVFGRGRPYRYRRKVRRRLGESRHSSGIQESALRFSHDNSLERKVRKRDRGMKKLGSLKTRFEKKWGEKWELHPIREKRGIR